MVDSPPARHSAAPRTVVALTPLTLAAVAIGLIPFVLHAITIFQGYFWQDDFAIVHRAMKASLADPAYLFQDYNDHVAPGLFLIAGIVTAIEPLGYPVAVLPLLLLQAAATVQFWRLLTRCFGQRPAVLVPFAMFAFSPLVLFTTQWWAFALQMIPLLLAIASALGSHVRYLDTGRRRHAVYAVLWVLFGLAFFQKAALLPALMVGLTALMAPGSPSLWSALRGHWRLWTGYLLLIAGYAAVYLSLSGARDGARQPGDQGTVEYFGRAVVDTFLRGVLGGPWSGDASTTLWAPPPFEGRVLVLLATALIVAAGILLTRRRAVHAWLFAAGYLLVDLALVAFARLPAFGAMLAADPRFVVDAGLVAILFGAFAFLSPVSARAEESPVWSGPVRHVAVGLTVAYAVGAVVSTSALAPALKFRESREYVAGLRATIAADPEIVLYDTQVPDTVMWRGGFGDAALISRMVDLLPQKARFDEPTEKLYQLDDQGRPQQITGLVNPRNGEEGPVKDCGWVVGEEITMVRLPEQVTGRRVVLINYYTKDSGEGSVIVGAREQIVQFQAGVHQLALVVDGSFGRVDLRRNTSVAPVCVVAVQVGQPLIRTH